MKIQLLACSAILMAFGAISAFAADLSGGWSAQMTGPNGDGMQLAFSFKQSGTKLTGTVAGPQGDPIEISDGKVDGDKVSFIVSFNGMTIRHEGTITGDSIKITSKADDKDFPAGEMTLTRSK